MSGNRFMRKTYRLNYRVRKDERCDNCLTTKKPKPMRNLNEVIIILD